ncbi:hypothetical protein FHS18_006945 [Paenibacillus phyllosphaerae]|uniref:SMI1/KNR4 family protein n=1 Tax=Paenibacillus phyllosphaerae TaxID=274593 RepID=A0A7W5B5H4_9BACL|nr:hypothetical protein [Paenibacillus phyllosphaerae]
MSELTWEVTSARPSKGAIQDVENTIGIKFPEDFILHALEVPRRDSKSLYL